MNYNSFLEIYQELNEEAFRNAVQDYFFVEKGYSFSDVIEILNIHVATVFSERLGIEDELALIEIFGDEEYREFSQRLEELAKTEAKEAAEGYGFAPEEIKLALMATA